MSYSNSNKRAHRRQKSSVLLPSVDKQTRFPLNLGAQPQHSVYKNPVRSGITSDWALPMITSWYNFGPLQYLVSRSPDPPKYTPENEKHTVSSLEHAPLPSCTRFVLHVVKRYGIDCSTPKSNNLQKWIVKILEVISEPVSHRKSAALRHIFMAFRKKEIRLGVQRVSKVTLNFQ